MTTTDPVALPTRSAIPVAILADRRLTSDQKLVALALYHLLGPDGLISAGDLARDTDLDKRSILRTVAALEMAGWISVTRDRKRRDGSPDVNAYRVNAPKK